MRVSLGRHFYSRRKGSGRNLTKNDKFLIVPHSKLFIRPEKKKKKKQLQEAKRKFISADECFVPEIRNRKKKKKKKKKKRQENCFRLRKPNDRNLKQKKRKKGEL